MKLNKRIILVQIFAIIGLLLSIKLSMIYYNANYNKYALASFCSINDFVDCDGAARTVFSQFLGIPLSYWGIFLYLTILFLTFVDKLKTFKYLKFLEVFKSPIRYIAFLGLISFICSMILAVISLFVIKKLCILCFITYVTDLAIALTAFGCSLKELIEVFKTTFKDFVDGVKQYPKTFTVLLLVFTGFLTYSGITLNFVPNVKSTKSIMKYSKMKYNPYRVNGNILGNPDGNVVIELYSDYVCPICYIQNIMLHQAVKEYKNIKINHHNIPFDKECNPGMAYSVHKGACFMSKAAIAAKKQGDYWGMSSLLYEKQPHNVSTLMILADELNIDKNKFLEDFNSKETSDILSKEVEEANKLNINATPTMIINGQTIVGMKPYYKLQELLEKYGAKK